MSEQPPEGEVERFWADARRHARLETMPGYFGPTAIASVAPPTWSFGDDEPGDRLLGLVLDGAKTATASARADYASAEDLPSVGTMSILLDGGGHPRALLVTTAVDVVAFDEVDEAHAAAEGEGDLAQWRSDHETFFTEHDDGGHGFRTDMPVVLERFEVLHPVRRSALDSLLGRR